MNAVSIIRTNEKIEEWLWIMYNRLVSVSYGEYEVIYDPQVMGPCVHECLKHYLENQSDSLYLKTRLDMI